MPAGTRVETKTIDRILAIACATAGIGFQISNKQLTSNVATITTISAHGYQVGDKITVKGVDSVFDGIDIVITAVTTTTISYAKVNANIASTAVASKPVAGVSKFVSCGYKRWADDENFDKIVRSKTAETQGHFWAALKNVAHEGENEKAVFSVAAELAIAVTKDVSSDLNLAWEFAFSLRDALQASGNYNAGSEFWPVITIGMMGVDVSQGMGLIVFDFGLGDAGGAMTVQDP